MTPDDYKFLSELLLKTSGLCLGDNRQYLVEKRLAPLAQSSGFDSLDDLIQSLRSNPGAATVHAVAEAMATNETLFFRDAQPFEDLRNTLLPRLLEARRHVKQLRIWSAAASTGQEAYSIGMLLRHHFPELDSWQIEIIGTDISSKALDRARQGVYSQFEIQRGLPVQMLIRYFEQVSDGWKVKSEIRDMVRFREQNLLQAFSRLGRFDIIFCRNVLIYFDVPTRTRLLDRLVESLSHDGFLLLGASETLLGVTDHFERFSSCQSAVYAPATFKNGPQGATAEIGAPGSGTS